MPYKDPERRKQYAKEYYQKNTEKKKQASKKWVTENRERHLENKRRRYRKNKVKHAEGIRRSRRKHPEETREQVRKGRAKVKEEAATKIGVVCSLCGRDSGLCFHEIHFRDHKRGASGIFEARKHPEDFMRTCRECHSVIHILHRKFDVQFEDLKKFLLTFSK
jgi:hypothetical protein